MNRSNLRATSLAAALALGATAAAAAGPVAEVTPAGFIECFHTCAATGERTRVAVIPNIVPAAARSYLLRAGVAGASQTSLWYIAPFINEVDPPDNLTAANFEATLDEFTNYTETTRPLWDQEAEASQAIVNGTNLAVITIGSGGGTINGIVLTSINTKGSSAGLILAATQFADPRTMVAGDTLEFRYTLQANLPA